MSVNLHREEPLEKMQKSLSKSLGRIIFASLITLLMLSGCVQPAPGSRPWSLDSGAQPPDALNPGGITLPTLRPQDYIFRTPTPDAPRILPTLRANEELYVIQPGDYLSLIAGRYNLDVSTLINANPHVNPNWIEIGQVITIPAPSPSASPSSFKIIPDSELVYGPMSSTLDTESFVNRHRGYLATYTEDVDERSMSGSAIVQRIAYEYSVNPRLLLALLDWRSGWVTHSSPSQSSREYPMGLNDINRKGLYRQLAWAANQLNRGYYAWKDNAISYMVCTDGSLVMLSPTVNAGTVGVQVLLAALLDLKGWQYGVSESGLYSVYSSLFVIPFDLGIEPLLPAGLSQPHLLLPFEEGSTWSFTGGPHAGWGSGSPWAAVDFAPPGTAFGCFTSNAWVTAAADGLILRARDGEVVQDLDGDGLEQTGWTLVYMHIESRDRVSAGTYLKAGDRIGHASCEGGVSNGTHVHFARRFNGEWIPAVGSIPMVLSGWLVTSTGGEYEGTLIRNGATVWSWDGRTDDNQIAH
jgi:murein DD-endopeptidase MepM/ murein hydrolase activator NlpD